MPIPFILWGAAAAAAAYGGKKAIDAHDNNNAAETYRESAQKVFEVANNRLEKQRALTNTSLETLGATRVKCWSEDMGSFVKAFKKFKNVKFTGEIGEENINIESEEFKALESSTLKASEMVKGGLGSLAAGTLAGVAAYGGVGMFAAASTGTAISGLSGVAATNATLAWLGGGSLAAGGFGVAGGTLVLGGIVAAPILAVAGAFMAAKSEENLANAKRMFADAQEKAEQLGIMEDTLRGIKDISDDYNKFILAFSEHFKSGVGYLENVYNENKSNVSYNFGAKNPFASAQVDFSKLNEEEQRGLHIVWLMAQTMKALLVQNIMNKEGKVDEEAKKLLRSSKNEWAD